MRVRVLFFGQLKDITGKSEEVVEVRQGGDLSALFGRYAAEFPRLDALRGAVVPARNREFADWTVALVDGDEVAFLPPVSGGTDDLVRIVRAPIDTRALVQQLQRGEDGAVVVFEGVVRNHSGNRTTLFLEYEAYEPMALEKMRELAREARERWAIDGIAIVHRLGRLEIGEAGVVIVVTAAHRGPAFEACRATIDRLKKTVPIWKKEHFADGAVWVEGDWDASLAGRFPVSP